jgi:GNAT superfamily N-acetyltransferase
MKGVGAMVQTKGPSPIPFSKFELEVWERIALSDSPKVLIRPVSPGDEDGLREMLSRLSRETIHKRFHLPMPRVPEWALAYLTDVDHYDKESLVALVGDEIVGQAMYVRQEAREAEMAIVVEDRWQSRGIGKLLLSRLAEEAGRRQIESFTGTVLGENRDALRFFSSVLSKVKFKTRNSVYHLYVPLPGPEPVRSLKPPGGARRGETLKTIEDEERTMETSTRSCARVRSDA